jgi:hypothetical protein
VTASLSLRVCTGSAAGTESSSQIGFAFMDIDSASNAPDANEVTPGANSFEKWLRLALDDAAGQSVSAFWVERTGALPDGVVVKIGYAAAGVTPTATTSVVATTTMAAGRRYFFDTAAYSATDDRTQFLVLQEQVAASAASGQIDTQAIQFGWSASAA